MPHFKKPLVEPKMSSANEGHSPKNAGSAWSTAATPPTRTGSPSTTKPLDLRATSDANNIGYQWKTNRGNTMWCLKHYGKEMRSNWRTINPHHSWNQRLINVQGCTRCILYTVSDLGSQRDPWCMLDNVPFVGDMFNKWPCDAAEHSTQANTGVQVTWNAS